MLEELRKQLDAQVLSERHSELPSNQVGLPFLAFRVDQQEMLIALSDVREIILPTWITFLPNSSREIEGVTALQGEIMPVVNLRRLLGFSRIGLTNATRCLLVSPNDLNFVLIVDEIFDVVRLANHEIDSVAQGYLSDEFKVVKSISKNSSAVRPILDVKVILESVFNRERCNEQNPH